MRWGRSANLASGVVSVTAAGLRVEPLPVAARAAEDAHVFFQLPALRAAAGVCDIAPAAWG